MRKTPLQRIVEDKDFPVMQAIISYLRSRAPALVPTTEIVIAVGRSAAQVYGLIKKGRVYLRLTTGEYIPNDPRTTKRPGGYTVTDGARAGLYEQKKAGDRADGHLAQELALSAQNAARNLSTPEDRELYRTLVARAAFARARLEFSGGMQPLVHRLPENSRLSHAARSASETPWEMLGLEAPRSADTDDDDIS